MPFEVDTSRYAKEKAVKWLLAEIQKGEDSLLNEPLMTLEESRNLLGV